MAITLATIASMVGADSGGCFNPTIGFTESTYMLMANYDQESSYFKYILVYIFGPLGGGLLAGLFLYYIALRVPVGEEADDQWEDED